jgi:phosphoglycerate dehydrogenase-like enzyme
VPYAIYKGRQLGSIVFGIVGFGATGRAVAHRLRGLVREIVVADPRVSAAEVLDAACRPVGLAQLLALADVVSVHARSETQIIGREQLAAMRPGSYLINTARGTVLDYDALADALDRGHLRGAALDVFPEEPLPASTPLIGLPGLTMTPHIAGATEEVTDRQSEIMLEAIRSLYRPETAWQGVPVRNPEVRAKWLTERSLTSNATALRPASTSTQNCPPGGGLPHSRPETIPGTREATAAPPASVPAPQLPDDNPRRQL